MLRRRRLLLMGAVGADGVPAVGIPASGVPLGDVPAGGVPAGVVPVDGVPMDGSHPAPTQADPVRAAAGDWPDVRALLAASGLPLDGAAEAFATGVVVRDGERLVGCAAIEPYGKAALLRSVAVAPDRRGTGIGRRLVGAAEDLARDGGATTLILLTETAAAWFDRLGYATIDRSAVPADVARSVEFATACPTSAVVMRRTLAGTEIDRLAR